MYIITLLVHQVRNATTQQARKSGKNVLRAYSVPSFRLEACSFIQNTFNEYQDTWGTILSQNPGQHLFLKNHLHPALLIAALCLS